MDSNSDAATLLVDLFKQYGLESLSPKIVQLIQSGESSDAVTLKLQDTTEYKERFSGNEARKRAGLPPLSPKEYIDTERAYRQVMQTAGLPIGFYDKPSDFHNFIGGDVSPTELQGRVDTVFEAVNNAPSGTFDVLKKWYDVSDIVAYALDPNRAKGAVDAKLKAAEAASRASRVGVNVSQAQAEDIARRGISAEQQQSAFSSVAGMSSDVSKLSAIHGMTVNEGDLVDAALGTGVTAAKTLSRLTGAERGVFAGTGGVSVNATGKDVSGKL